MLKPDKHLNLDYSILNISALILRELKINSLMTFDDLSKLIVSKIGDVAKESAVYALNFLFLLGKITYHTNIDSFELNETE